MKNNQKKTLYVLASILLILASLTFVNHYNTPASIIKISYGVSSGCGSGYSSYYSFIKDSAPAVSGSIQIPCDTDKNEYMKQAAINYAVQYGEMSSTDTVYVNNVLYQAKVPTKVIPPVFAYTSNFDPYGSPITEVLINSPYQIKFDFTYPVIDSICSDGYCEELYAKSILYDSNINVIKNSDWTQISSNPPYTVTSTFIPTYESIFFANGILVKEEYRFNTANNTWTTSLNLLSSQKIQLTTKSQISPTPTPTQTPSATQGILHIRSSPVSASIFINGVDAHMTTNVSIPYQPGTYTVLLKAQGYYDYTANIPVEYGMNSYVNGKLIPIPPVITPTPTPTVSPTASPNPTPITTPRKFLPATSTIELFMIITLLRIIIIRKK